MAYLLDANVFMQAKNLHYGLDFCPAFWDWLVEANAALSVFSIEKVGDEIAAGHRSSATATTAAGVSISTRYRPAASWQRIAGGDDSGPQLLLREVSRVQRHQEVCVARLGTCTERLVVRVRGDRRRDGA